MKQKRIWTNGCFDILHRGHIELFRYAKSLGGELTVDQVPGGGIVSYYDNGSYSSAYVSHSFNHFSFI